MTIVQEGKIISISSKWEKGKNMKDLYVQPITKDLEEGIQVTTWKYDYDQSLFNFELKFPLEFVAKNGIHYEEKSFFLIIIRRLQK
ncbi:hypothetical protein [Bacillus velezensis]|uniref:hypothetical protein n=1 Tax=Bacillus velezensis TaxID=492670 RepID=UPI0018E85964|nr:hypothetical protein [Bacillus velezensis]